MAGIRTSGQTPLQTRSSRRLKHPDFYALLLPPNGARRLTSTRHCVIKALMGKVLLASDFSQTRRRAKSDFLSVFTQNRARSRDSCPLRVGAKTIRAQTTIRI